MLRKLYLLICIFVNCSGCTTLTTVAEAPWAEPVTAPSAASQPAITAVQGTPEYKIDCNMIQSSSLQDSDKQNAGIELGRYYAIHQRLEDYIGGPLTEQYKHNSDADSFWSYANGIVVAATAVTGGSIWFAAAWNSVFLGYQKGYPSDDANIASKHLADANKTLQQHLMNQGEFVAMVQAPQSTTSVAAAYVKWSGNLKNINDTADSFFTGRTSVDGLASCSAAQ